MKNGLMKFKKLFINSFFLLLSTEFVNNISQSTGIVYIFFEFINNLYINQHVDEVVDIFLNNNIFFIKIVQNSYFPI